jgi:RNA polymerase subunit RPABC4/transcription elongation factor Spt4
MIFDPETFSNFLLLATAWGGAFLVALWISLIVWTFRDIRARKSDPLLRFLAVLVVAVLFIPGIVIYLLIRPQATLEEEYQKTLEEEALLRAIEEVRDCPGCGIRTKNDWMICPNCHTKLQKTCHQCWYLMELQWNLCPHCGTPAPGMHKENMTLDEALRPLPTDSSEEID